MSSFASQVSNLSALSSGLGSFSRILKINDDRHDDGTVADEEVSNNARKHDDVMSFLNSQHHRLSSIDQQLLDATDRILPISSESMSITEMAELCRLVQLSNRHRIERLKVSLEAAGYNLPKADKNNNNNNHSNTNQSLSIRQRLQLVTSSSSSPPEEMATARMQHWTLGRPLERVSEGDTETESGITPKSINNNYNDLSPFSNLASSNRKHSLTPTTPTMDSLSFSVNTNSILENEGATTVLEPRFPSSSRQLSKDHHDFPHGSPLLKSQPNFDAFTDDDDMITLDTYSTLAARSIHSQQRSEIFQEEKSAWNMSRMLEQVDESLLESRPSDEANSTKTPSIAASAAMEDMTRGSNSDNNDDDDSTNVVATVIAADVQQRRGETLNDSKMTNNNSPSSYNKKYLRMKDRHHRGSSLFQGPTHIVVDNALASPAHTNITMDATMMNDTFMSYNGSIVEDEENASTMTPILDRYRLDADDCTIGIKVVPNKRGHKGRRSTKLSSESSEHSYEAKTTSESSFSYEAKNTFPMTVSVEKPVLSTPASLPGSVSARKKKQYRKTPHPKKAGRIDDVSIEEENENPNISRDGLPGDENIGSRGMNTMFSISVPPLRPHSFEPPKNLSVTSRESRALSLPGGSSKPLSQTPLTTAFIQKYMSPSHSGPNPAYHSNSEKIEDNRQLSIALKKQLQMERITMAEYEGAPCVVRMQVTRDEANQAATVLEEMLTYNHSQGRDDPLEFTEQDAYEILKDTFATESRSKSVLMSLCHWRRLLMYRDEQHGMIFSINQFDR